MSKATLLADLRIILRHLNRLPSDGVNSFKAHTMAQVGTKKHRFLPPEIHRGARSHDDTDNSSTTSSMISSCLLCILNTTTTVLLLLYYYCDIRPITLSYVLLLLLLPYYSVLLYYCTRTVVVFLGISSTRYYLIIGRFRHTGEVADRGPQTILS